MAGGAWAIVVAAGRGDRFGALKQFAELDGERVVDRSVATALRCCDGVVLVLPPDRTWDGADVDAVVPGGATRSDSVRAGMAAIADDVEVVVVHDAARPLASDELFASVIAAVGAGDDGGGADGAIPGVEVADTIKRIDPSRVVVETIARDGLVAVQTPQAFRASTLRAAHATAGDATDDAALVERVGGTVVVVEGEVANLKITDPDDLADALRALGASSA